MSTQVRSLVLLTLSIPLAARVATNPGVTLASVSSAGAQGNSYSTDAFVSADGRVVAFTSNASNLVAGDTNGSVDVFVRDLATGQTTRASVSTAGVQGNSDSKAVAISGNGKVVAFTSYATNLVTPDIGGNVDLFVRDLEAGTTTRVNVSSAGEQANDATFGPCDLSADGRFIVFASSASNLVASDSTGFVADVFVHDRQTATTSLVSVDSFGTQLAGTSYDPAMTPDGRYVVFVSFATQYSPANSAYPGNVYRRDLWLGITDLVSTSYIPNPSGYQGAALPCSTPDISADGNMIIFHSTASNLVPESNFPVADHIFARNFVTNYVFAVDKDANGNLGNYPALIYPRISASGNKVLFQTRAMNLCPETVASAGKANWIRASLGTGHFELVSVTPGGTPGNNASWILVPGGISANGDVCAFASAATDLVAGDTNGTAYDVFVWGADPSLESAFPPCGPLAGGTRVTLSGEAFDAGGVAVTFGGAPATNVVVLSSATIQCTAPAGSAGASDIVVSSASGVTTLPGGFTYTDNLGVYGNGTPGCAGIQEIAAAALPGVGAADFGVVTESAPANALGLLLIADAQDIAGSDPFSIGAKLHVDLFLAANIVGLDATSSGAGESVCAVPIPNNPALTGSVWYAQTLWVWASCSLPPFGLSSSRGLRFTIP